jgi:hypothetical protein
MDAYIWALIILFVSMSLLISCIHLWAQYYDKHPSSGPHFSMGMGTLPPIKMSMTSPSTAYQRTPVSPLPVTPGYMRTVDDHVVHINDAGVDGLVIERPRIKWSMYDDIQGSTMVPDKTVSKSPVGASPDYSMIVW